MKNKTKAELLSDLENMTEEKDILVDKLEGANYTIKDLEEEVSELEGKAETLDIFTDLVERLHTATIRFNLGVLTDKEEIENITQKILDTRY